MSYCLLLFKQNRSSNSFNQIAANNNVTETARETVQPSDSWTPRM